MLQFTHPALLFGAALFAVPLIIHLLNRQRFKRRPWAAMEFLLAAYKKQRRRLRSENLLLLLLRCLIPIILALAIARPVLREENDVGGTSGLTHHVLVFDHSYSTGLAIAGRSPFERSKSLATGLLERIGRNSAPQKVSLVVNGLRPRVVVSESMDVQRAKAQVTQLPPPVDAGPPLTEALLQVADLVEESTDPEVRVHLFTDLQVRAFGTDPFAPEELGADQPETAPPTEPAKDPEDDAPSADMFKDSAIDAIKRIREKGRLTVFDTRQRGGNGGTEDNLRIVDLRLERSHAIQNVPIPIVATVNNRTTATAELQVKLEIDGGQPVRKPLRVDAGADGDVEFEVVLREPGDHRIAVSIEGDDLSADNRRFAIVRVREKIRVLVVEGTNEDDENLRESTHALEILDPTGGEGPPELTQFALTSAEFLPFLTGRIDPSDFDVVILANLPEISAEVAETLLDAVRGGTGLMVMLGDRANVDSFNRQLHRAGEGPMPGRLRQEVGFEVGGERYFASAIERTDHPVFADMVDESQRELLESLPVWRYIAMERPPEDVPETEPTADDERVETTQVLLSVRDPERSPLWVASTFGAGKALFVTSPVNRRPGNWNSFDTPLGGIAFMVLWPTVQWLALPATDERNVIAGGTLVSIVDEKPANLRVVPPEAFGTSVMNIGEEPAPLLGDRFALPTFRRTDYAGFYDYQFELDESQESRNAFFAVNPDVDEGDLTYYAHAAAKETLGIETILSELPSSGGTAADSESDELGPMLLMLLLVLLTGEAAMARWVARRRT